MIWDPCNIDTESRNSDIVSHITAEIDTVCGNEYPDMTSENEEVARAVETFVAQEPDGSFVDSGYLVMLASHALSSIGKGQAARRLLLLGTNMVSPSEWEVTGCDSMWVLDLNRMTVRADMSLELMFFKSLNIIVESISDVWDNTSGFGVLGLRHVCSTASALLGSVGKKKNTLALSNEILVRCQRKLSQTSIKKGWENIPQVMNLDLV